MDQKCVFIFLLMGYVCVGVLCVFFCSIFVLGGFVLVNVLFLVVKSLCIFYILRK
jgi:hypothetical protein